MTSRPHQTSEDERQNLLRQLPSVSAVLANPAVESLSAGLRAEITVAVAQRAIERVRSSLRSGDGRFRPDDAVAETIRELTQLVTPKLSTVINGTGVIIHTNLGRAPVSQETAEAMLRAASSYTPLELEIETGLRGGRMAEITRLMAILTGAEASLVVNNNAAAILLVLSALCQGREVLLSRGQAVEIGGGFRVPDVMRQSGASLVEVGTTNRTYARDYENQITERTAALLAVHWSNFRIVGFTAQPTLEELATVARARDVLLLEDLGSGALADTARYGLMHEPTVGESLRAGVDVVCFSGDKLLGGPQAGIIAGGADLVARIAAHPLARAVRADKTALAGVAQTLRHYLRDDYAAAIPVWQMISASVADLEARCRRWLERLDGFPGLELGESVATVGGGSLPGETLPSRAIVIRDEVLQARGCSLDEVARRLRAGRPPLMPHVAQSRLLIDARTVLPDQDDAMVTALARALDAI